jgi:hypothetical protein
MEDSFKISCFDFAYFFLFLHTKPLSCGFLDHSKWENKPHLRFVDDLVMNGILIKSAIKRVKGELRLGDIFLRAIEQI